MTALTGIYNVDDESSTEENDDDDDSWTSKSCHDSWTSRSGDELPDEDVLLYNDISSNDNGDDNIGDDFDVTLFQEVNEIVQKYNRRCNPNFLPKSF